jgi:transketolase
MLRGNIPKLFTEPMRLGRARLLSGGDDIALFSSGICTEEAMRAVQALKKQGVSIRHLHVMTLKPFDDIQICDAVASARYGVIAMENHTVIGGLGSAVAEVMAEKGISKRLVKIGLQDTFAHGASRTYLMKEYGLDLMAPVRRCENLLGRKLIITEADMAEVQLPPGVEMGKEVNPEDL